MNTNCVSLLCRLVLSSLNRDGLIVFGDSHSATFSNVDRVEIVHVGPATAHNLVEKGSTISAREQILDRLAASSPSQFAVVLSFGEIDCRVHLIKAASLNESRIREVVTETVDRYFALIQVILEMGYPVLVYGPAGSGSEWDPQFPTVGREEERNYSVQLFNSILREKCKCSNAVVVSIDELVIDPVSGKTRREFLSDGFHLNYYPNTTPELQAIIFSRFLVSLQSASGKPRGEYRSEHRLRMDHALHKPFTLTSTWGNFAANGVVTNSRPFFFHTGLGADQGIHIDLLSAFVVDEVVIHNRTDCCQDRAHNLYLNLRTRYDDPGRTEAVIVTPEFLAGVSSFVSVRFKPCLARFIFVYSGANTYLHLSGVEVLGGYSVVCADDSA